MHDQIRTVSLLMWLNSLDLFEDALVCSFLFPINSLEPLLIGRHYQWVIFFLSLFQKVHLFVGVPANMCLYHSTIVTVFIRIFILKKKILLYIPVWSDFIAFKIKQKNQLNNNYTEIGLDNQEYTFKMNEFLPPTELASGK